MFGWRFGSPTAMLVQRARSDRMGGDRRRNFARPRRSPMAGVRVRVDGASRRGRSGSRRSRAGRPPLFLTVRQDRGLRADAFTLPRRPRAVKEAAPVLALPSSCGTLAAADPAAAPACCDPDLRSDPSSRSDLGGGNLDGLWSGGSTPKNLKDTKDTGSSQVAQPRDENPVQPECPWCGDPPSHKNWGPRRPAKAAGDPVQERWL